MSNKDKKADEYANQKVRDKNLYPCVEFSRRKQLTTFDAYELADAFEAGWDAATKELSYDICEFIKNNLTKYYKHGVFHTGLLIDELKKLKEK